VGMLVVSVSQSPWDLSTLKSIVAKRPP
jgi:hypothetical protein